MQGFDFRLERLAGNAERRRRTPRPGDPSVARRERRLDHPPLTLGERGHRARRPLGRLVSFLFEPGLVDCERLALAQHHGAFDHALQLAHIPWPDVAPKQLQRLLVDVADGLSDLLGVSLDQILDQDRNVIPALA